MKIKRLLIVSKEYPTEREPLYAFVDQLARAIADQGVHVDVCAPASATRTLLRGREAAKRVSEIATGAGNRVTVYRPFHISFSNKKILGIDFAMRTLRDFERAVKGVIASLPEKPDAVYGHFIAPAGLCAAKLGIPAFLGAGESEAKRYAAYPDSFIRERLSSLRGAVAVSGENRRILLEKGFVKNPDSVGLFPNGVDPKVFFPADGGDMRKALHIAPGEFTVAFVGSFTERKGIDRLCRALSDLPGARAILIGSGPIAPDCPDIAFQGSVPHERVADYLRAADAFCLPTRAEGCCNAIVEALACGLPVISSNRPFNDGLLSETHAILVDPESVSEIAAALRALKGDLAYRNRLKEGAREKGRTMTIEARAQAILRFMEERL